jgi:hypothetical protein
MWPMVKSSFGQLLRGKLFADPGKAYRQIALGIVVTALLMLGAVAAGAPLWGAAIVAGFIGGALQPYLFKDLRYR